MRHNFRNSLGQFAKVPAVTPVQAPTTIVAGRLYGYRGTVVRARQKCANGKRHVSFHKQLHGFVDERELTVIPTEAVRQYLADVGIKA